jgi:hypothetical protein
LVKTRGEEIFEVPTCATGMSALTVKAAAFGYP